MRVGFPLLFIYIFGGKMSKKLIEELKDIFEKEIEELGYELVDVEFVREEGENFLRFFIYNDPVTTIDDCQKCSHYISERLDELDPIQKSYYLEVSSPDLNRPLKNDKDLRRNLGQILDISLYKKLDNKKEYRGELLSYDQDHIKLKVENKKGEQEVIIERQLISKIMVAIIF